MLELAYREYTGDALRLSIESSDAKTALRRFVDTMFRPSSSTVFFNQILQDENRFGGRHVRRLLSVKRTYVEVIKLVQSILDKGVEEGVFGRGVDPRELYISLVGVFNLRTVNAKTPALLSMPEIAPSAESETPAGRAPSPCTKDQTYGGSPRTAARGAA